MIAALLATVIAACVVSQPAPIRLPRTGDICHDLSWGDVAVTSPSGPPTCRIWYVSDGTIVPQACIEFSPGPAGLLECDMRPDPCGDSWLFWTVRPVVGGIVMFSFSEPGIQ